MSEGSIHPRSWPSIGNGKKLNTCEPRSTQRRLLRALAGIERHLEKHPNDLMSVARVTAIKATLAGQPASTKRAA